MLKIEFSNAFHRDYKRLKKRKYNMSALDNIIALLASGQKLPGSYVVGRLLRVS